MAVITRVRITAGAFFTFIFVMLLLFCLLFLIFTTTTAEFTVTSIESFEQYVHFYRKNYKEDEYAYFIYALFFILLLFSYVVEVEE